MCRACFLLLVLTALLSGDSAYGLSCIFRSLDEHFDLAQSVIVARVESISESPDRKTYELTLLNMENLKGSKPNQFRLSAPKSAWTSPLSKFIVGSDYLFFLRAGQYSVGNCDPSRSIEKVPAHWLVVAKQRVAP